MIGYYHDPATICQHHRNLLNRHLAGTKEAEIKRFHHV